MEMGLSGFASPRRRFRIVVLCPCHTKQKPRQLVICLFARDGSGKFKSLTRLSKSLQTYRSAESRENTVILAVRLIFPPKQQAAPREAGAEAGDEDQVPGLNSFRINSFRKANGNRSRGRIRIPVDI